jgi:N-methylhydantoinase A
MSWRLAVDIGGTFTDLVLLDGRDGTAFTRKVSSTPDDYARAILQGIGALLAEARVAPGELAAVLHATTVGSNAVLQRAGAVTGLITTEGFRDALEIRDLRMPRLYDLTWTKPAPLVPRRLRREVPGRVRPDGSVNIPLDEARLRAEIAALLDAGVESLAICLLNAPANPDQERRAGDIARQMAPGIPVCLSHEVLPEFGEYPRSSTTVINAYLLPVIGRYLARLEGGLREAAVAAPLALMQSSGGLLPASSAAERPMLLIESGPAAGAIGARALAQSLGLPRAIAFDMGGTTAKAALVEAGEVVRTQEIQAGAEMLQASRLLSGAGHTLRVPAVDLAEVGAGGGSICALDAGGVPQVGPRSAGADPGPACYGRGNAEPTLTDCHLLLGWLNPGGLAGGLVPLDRGLAEEAVRSRLAAPLGLTVEDAAFAMVRIACATMLRAIRAVTTERGRDPRDHALIAFGGNGPLLAGLIAAEAGIAEVVVPPAAGLFSAVGLLAADVEHHLVQGLRIRVTAETLPRMATTLEALAAEGAARLARDGVPEDRAEGSGAARMRYVGQSSELEVALPSPLPDATGVAALFAEAHRAAYGYAAPPEEPVETVAVTWLARARTEPGATRLPRRLAGRRTRPAARRRIHLGPAGWQEVAVLDALALDAPVTGPAVIESEDSTCLVPPGATARRDGEGNLRLRLA